MRKPLFHQYGAHVLVDGSFGSTGKGVLAAWLAAHQVWHQRIAGVISNAGPNSGHTFYHGDEKHVLKQLPTFAVASHLLGYTIPVYLSAGAIIDPYILRAEMERYPGIPVTVHPNAAVITEADRNAEADPAGTISAVAGTRSGTGMALARKIMRDPAAIAVNCNMLSVKNLGRWELDWWDQPYFVEVSQGFSLGINQPFYPKVTSRECTVSQALADAGLPPAACVRTYMSCRTFPIRVGNVDGHSSGDWYPDQEETSWEALGVKAERTTVTNRIRRVATFSEEQFRQACLANHPNFVFMNFMNYLTPEGRIDLSHRLDRIRDGMPQWFDIILGYGPKSEDVKYG